MHDFLLCWCSSQLRVTEKTWMFAQVIIFWGWRTNSFKPVKKNVDTVEKKKRGFKILDFFQVWIPFYSKHHQQTLHWNTDNTSTLQVVNSTSHQKFIHFLESWLVSETWMLCVWLTSLSADFWGQQLQIQTKPLTRAKITLIEVNQRFQRLNNFFESRTKTTAEQLQ